MIFYEELTLFDQAINNGLCLCVVVNLCIYSKRIYNLIDVNSPSIEKKITKSLTTEKKVLHKLKSYSERGRNTDESNEKKGGGKRNLR